MSTVRIQVRRGTASQWTSVNPILAAGEMGVESDTNLFKFGNGTSTWTALAYANNSDVAIAEISQDAINNALSLGAGLSKTYNDGANTITINVDSNVVALKSYVDAAVTGLANTVDTDYLPVSDRGVAGGVASLDNAGKVPNAQIDDNNWATKLHVASVASGLQIKLSVAAASTANFASTRSAGTADASGGTGVGEYLTASANGALIIDGYTLAASDRVLLKNQTDAKQNGIYVVTNAGGSSSAAILTRATDADNSVDGEVREGLFTFVQNGTANNRDGYVLLAEGSRAGEIFQLGTDSLSFSQFTGAVPVSVGSGLTNSDDAISVDTSVIATKAYVNAIDNTLTQVTANHTTLLAGIATKNNEQDSAVAQNTANIATNTSGLAAAVAVNNTQNTRLTNLETADITLGAQITSTTNAAVTTLETTLRSDLAPKAAPTFTGTVVLPATTSIGSVSATEIAYVDGVTSGIQGQLDAKLATTSASSTYATIANDNLKAPLANPTFTGTVVLPSTTSIGNVSATEIGYVDGVTSAIQTQLDAKLATSTASSTYATIANDNLKAPLASPALTGVPTAPTAASGTSTTQVATTAFVGTAVSNLVASAPAALDTLNELATALGNDASFSTTITNALAAKAPLASPTFTGTSTVANITVSGTSNMSANGVQFSDGTQTKEGVPSRTTIASKTADYTLSALTERDSMIELNSSSPITLTIPANSSLAYPVGTTIDLLRVGSGSVTVSPGAGVTINATPGLKLRAQWSSATLLKRSTDTWVLLGDLTA